MEDDRRKFKRFAKYGGLSFQLLTYIAIGYAIGLLIDKKMNNTKPYGIAAGCILFLIIALFSVIKDVSKIE